MGKKLLLWIMAGSGIACLIWVASFFIESQSAMKWPQTKGQVISSLLVINHLPKFMEYNADPLRWYGTDVQYAYSVGNRSYVSNRIGVHDSDTRSPRSALAIMNKYRHHHEVPVYYDPSDPGRSVLEPGNIGDIYIPLMLGGLCAFLGLFLLYDQSLEVKPHAQDNYLYWANAYHKRGKYAEALKEYNKFIEIYPNLAQGYKSRGDLFFQLEQWEQAVADFTQAILIDPTDASVYFYRANAFLRQEQYSKAAADAQKAQELGLKINPEILSKIQKGL